MGIPRPPYPVADPPVATNLPPVILGPVLPPAPIPTVTKPTPVIPPVVPVKTAFKVATLVAVTSNVRNLPAHEDTIEDTFSKVLSKSKGSIICWQEVAPASNSDVPNYKNNLDAVTNSTWTNAFARASDPWYDAPISFKNTSYSLVSLTSSKIFKGVAGVSGARYLTTAVVKIKGTQYPISIKSLHTIPKAFTGTASEKKQRRPWYNAGLATLISEAKAATKSNLPQIIGGDMNNNGNSMPPKIAGYTVHAVHDGLDWLYFIDCKNYYWKMGSKNVIPKSEIHSDHNAVAKTVELWWRP